VIHPDEERAVYVFEFDCFGYLVHRGAFISTVTVNGYEYELLNEDIDFVEDYFEKE